MSAPSPSFQPDSTDLDRLHSAVTREKEDLQAGREPASMLVMFLAMLVAVIAGGQFSAVTGKQDFGISPAFNHETGADPRPGGGSGSVAMDPFQAAMKKGAGGYAVCGGCHQGNGLGLPGQFPPLAGSEWVLGGTERLIRVVQHGLVGAITVKGQGYNTPGGMQGFGAAMSAGDLANVLTFIRNSWGNEAPMITKEMVEKIRSAEKRATQWTMPELETFAKVNVEGVIPAGPGATAAAVAK